MKISEICPEAYNILAEVASTTEEALRLFDEVMWREKERKEERKEKRKEERKGRWAKAK